MAVDRLMRALASCASLESASRLCPTHHPCNRAEILAAGIGQDLIKHRRFGHGQLEFSQQFPEAALSGRAPAFYLVQHAGERERLQIKTQRFQDTGQNRLPASAVERLDGSGGGAVLRWRTP